MAHEDESPLCDCTPTNASQFRPLPPSDGTTINDALPTELLSLIFEIGCQMGQKDLTNTPVFSLVVSHVCSLWRAVALGTPTLWNYIAVDDDTPRKQIVVWLARSKATPLTIFAALDRPDVISLLVDHIERWEQASIQTCSTVSMRGMLSHLSGKVAPILRDLYIEDLDYYESLDGLVREDISIFDGPGSTPKMINLQLQGTSVNWNAHSFSAIKSLKFSHYPLNRRPSLDQFATLLGSCPTLMELAISDGIVNSADLTSREASPNLFSQRSILIPSLESLTLTNFTSVHAFNFHLRAIHAPNLKNLNIAYMCSGRSSHPVDFATSFELLTRGQGPSRTLTTIESLKLVAVRCESAEVLDSFFRGLLNLRRLHLRLGDLKEFRNPSEPLPQADHYLHAFIPEELTETAKLPLKEACPLLEEICIGGLGMKLLKDIVRTRSATLKRVRMWKGRAGVDEDTVGMIRSLGIQVDDYSDSESEPEGELHDDDGDSDDEGEGEGEDEDYDDGNDDGDEAEEDQEED